MQYLRRLTTLILFSTMAAAHASSPSQGEQSAPLAELSPASAAVGEDSQTARGDGERLICKREKTIGSNRTTRVCRTPEQIRQQQEATQGIMRSREASAGY